MTDSTKVSENFGTLFKVLLAVVLLLCSFNVLTETAEAGDSSLNNLRSSKKSIKSAVELDIDSNSVRGELYYYQLNESCKLFFHVQQQTKKDEGWVVALTLNSYVIPNKISDTNCLRANDKDFKNTQSALEKFWAYSVENEIGPINALAIDYELLGEGKKELVDYVRAEAMKKPDKKLTHNEADAMYFYRSVNLMLDESLIKRDMCEFVQKFQKDCLSEGMSTNLFFRRNVFDFSQVVYLEDAGLSPSTQILFKFKTD